MSHIIHTRRHTAKSSWTNSPASKERSLYLPSRLTRPNQCLSSPSALVVLPQLIPEKEKAQSSLQQVGVFLVLLLFRLSSAPPPYLVVTIRSLYHLHPVWTPSNTLYTSVLPSTLPCNPSPTAWLLWAILLWPQPINLLQLDNDL